MLSLISSNKISKAQALIKEKKTFGEFLTISLHFLIVSRFPRLKIALRALAEKLSDDNVSDKFTASGQMLTIINVFELPPASEI